MRPVPGRAAHTVLLRVHTLTAALLPSCACVCAPRRVPLSFRTLLGVTAPVTWRNAFGIPGMSLTNPTLKLMFEQPRMGMPGAARS